MKTIGMVLWIAAGIVSWSFMIVNLYQWWGVGGLIGGVFLAPGVIAFPFLYWLMEGVFPIMYFLLWAVGVFGFAVSVLAGAPQKDNVS